MKITPTKNLLGNNDDGGEMVKSVEMWVELQTCKWTQILTMVGLSLSGPEQIVEC